VSPGLDVLICGARAASTLQSGPNQQTRRVVSSERLENLPADGLNECVGEATHFVFCDAKCADLVPEQIETSREFAAGLLFFDWQDALRDVWLNLPAPLAALVRSPNLHFAVLIRTADFQASGCFRDVSDPIWEWLIRVSQQGGQITVIDSPTGDTPASVSRLPSLAPPAAERSDEWVRSQIHELKIGDSVALTALKAGLLQINDCLDESHQLSQSIEGEGPSGDYWHGIMHRREPDYSNAKYWFRRVGRHALFAELATRARVCLKRSTSVSVEEWKDRLLPGCEWDPFAFIDMCQRCNQTHDDELSTVAREIQFAEMLLLLDQSYRDAAG